MSPEMTAQTRKERFIRLDSASQASRASLSNEVKPPGLDHVAHIIERPNGKCIFIGDETKRRGACLPFEPPREQHGPGFAERAVPRTGSKRGSVCLRFSLTLLSARTNSGV